MTAAYAFIKIELLIGSKFFTGEFKHMQID
jgi:hypothetical protein